LCRRDGKIVSAGWQKMLLISCVNLSLICRASLSHVMSASCTLYPRLLPCTYRLADCTPDDAATTYAFAGSAGIVARGLTQTRTPRMMGCHCRPARLPAAPAPVRLHLTSYVSGRVGALPAWSRTTRGERLQGTIQMDTEISGGYTRFHLAVLVPDYLSPCPQTLAPDFVHDCRTKSGRCVHTRHFESYNTQYYTHKQIHAHHVLGPSFNTCQPA